MVTEVNGRAPARLHRIPGTLPAAVGRQLMLVTVQAGEGAEANHRHG